ncbi:MAG: metal ABC transporter ATP-binding protein [Muribaculaceae bacterium]
MRYPEGNTTLSGVDLSISQGDFVAITGRNGGGKTTLMRLVMQLLQPTSGEIAYYRGGERVKRLNIGYLPQKNMIDSRFPITIRQVVASGLDGTNRLFGRIAACDRQAVERAIELVGLGSVQHSGIGQVSGGQLQRALLARAIIGQREVLVLDEPLSYIDKEFEPRLYEIINDLARHTTMLLVSHEMTAISQMANRHVIVDGSVHECHAQHHFVPTQCR